MRKLKLCVVAIILALFAVTNVIADEQKTFTVIDACYVSSDTGCAILKDASGVTFKAEYSARTGATNGDTMTVLLDGNGKWQQITHDNNGLSAQIINVQEW